MKAEEIARIIEENQVLRAELGKVKEELGLATEEARQLRASLAVSERELAKLGLAVADYHFKVTKQSYQIAWLMARIPKQLPKPEKNKPHPLFR